MSGPTVRNPAVLFSMLALCGCDEVVRVRNLAPEVSVVAVCPDPQGAVVWVDVADPELDPVDLGLSFGARPLRIGATEDGVIGLSPDRAAPGRRHRIRWATEASEAASLCPTLDEPTRNTDCADARGVEAGERVVLAVVARDHAGVESGQGRPALVMGEGCESLGEETP